jgi:hypothetical protein
MITVYPKAEQKNTLIPKELNTGCIQMSNSFVQNEQLVSIIEASCCLKSGSRYLRQILLDNCNAAPSIVKIERFDV